MKEVTFLVHEEGETIEELKLSIKSGIDCYFENTADAPSFIW